MLCRGLVFWLLASVVFASSSSAVCRDWSLFQLPLHVGQWERIGDTLYGASDGLAIVDVSYPAAPAILGSLDIGGGIRSLAVGPTAIYAATVSGALVVIDATIPAAPTVVSSIATAATSLAIQGTRLYSVSADYLDIYDVSSPLAPVLLGSNYRPGEPSGVDPEWYWTLAKVQVGEPNFPLIYHGTYNEATMGGSSAVLTRVDAVNPANVDFFAPGTMLVAAGGQCGASGAFTENVGTVGVSSSTWANCVEFGALFLAEDLVVPGGPAASVLLAAGTSPGEVVAWEPGLAIWAVTEGSGPGFYTVDFSDLAAPSLGAFQATPETYGALYRVDDYLYTDDLTVFEVTGGVIQPVFVQATVELSKVTLGGPTVRDLELDGNSLLVTDGTSLSVIDVTDSEQTSVIASLGQPGAVHVRSNGAGLAIVAGTELATIDVTAPGAPVELGDLALASDAVAIEFLDANTVVMVDQASELHVVDVSSPLTPSIAGSDAALGGHALSTYLDRTYVLRDPELLTIDAVSNPSNPNRLSKMTIVDAFLLQTRDGRAYVGTRYSKSTIEIYDIVVGAHQKPQYLGTIDLPARALEFDAVGDILYVTVVGGEFRAYDVVNPAAPSLIASVPLAYGPLAATEDLLVASFGDDVFFFEPQCTAAAVAAPTVASAVSALHVWPNPASTGTQTAISFSAAEAGVYELTIFDVSGRRVASLFKGAAAVGAHHFQWSGDREAGGSVAAGVYFARLSGPLGGQAARVVRLP